MWCLDRRFICCKDSILEYYGMLFLALYIRLMSLVFTQPHVSGEVIGLRCACFPHGFFSVCVCVTQYLYSSTTVILLSVPSCQILWTLPADQTWPLPSLLHLWNVSVHTNKHVSTHSLLGDLNLAKEQSIYLMCSLRCVLKMDHHCPWYAFLTVLI